MAIPICLHLDRRILAVMLFQIQLHLRHDPLCIDRCCHIRSAFAQHQQDCFIHIIINQDYRLLGRLDQTNSKLICIKDLAIEENTFYRRQGSPDKEFNLIGQIPNPAVMFTQFLFNPAVRIRVDRMTLQYIFFQDLVSPLTKASSLFTFHPVTHRDNHVQIIIIHLISLSVGSSVGKFCPN